MSSLSPLSTASPEMIVLGGFAALSLAGVLRKVLLPRRAAVPAAIAVPAALPVAPNPAPPAPAQVVDCVTGLGVFCNLFANAIGFGLLGFAGHGIAAVGRRIVAFPKARVGSPCVSVGWENGALTMMNRLRRSIVLHGDWKKNTPNFVMQDVANFARGRMLDKIFQVLAPANARVALRGVAPMANFHFCGFIVRGVDLTRHTAGTACPLVECGNLRGDASWALFCFLIGKAFLLAHGATEEQAEHIACCGLIEAVGVACGQPAGADWGVAPGDFGFAAPATLPHH